jgi:DNA primase large subunit
MKYNYFIRYPFSKKAQDFLKEQDIDLFSVSEDIIKKATYFLLKTINLKFSDKEIQWRNYQKLDDKRIALLFVKLYPVSKILLNIVDYHPLYTKFASYYQEQLMFYIKHPFDKEEFDNIQKDLCNELKYDQNRESYYISLLDYLSYDLGEDHKLQYAKLEEGNIYFSRLELIDFLCVVLKKRILKNIDMEKKQFPKLFLEYGEALKGKILKENTYVINIINKPKLNEWPLCFKKIYEKLISRQKLSHIENFNLAVFLFNIGYTYEEILNDFKNLPNFDEKIAGYQIKKIMEKEYSVPNCFTLKSNGLCVNDCNVKHPFQLFKSNKQSNKKKVNYKKVDKK